MPDPLPVTDTIALEWAELTFSFVRSSGPGGQNVNKVATAAQLRFDVKSSPSLPPGVKARLMHLAGSRMTMDGILVIFADTHRSQSRNRAEAVSRLVDLIRAAALPPRPRRPTKPTLASKRRRLDAKAKRSALKSQRGARPPLD